MAPRITYSADASTAVTVPCKAFNHTYDDQQSVIFKETSLYFGTVWVQYDRCARDCGRVRMRIMTPGAMKVLTTRYRSENDDYDTTMSKAEARRLHALAAREATEREMAER